MKMGVAFGICLASFAMAGCGNKAQQLCEASIRSTLINPETAEFHGFLALNFDQAVDLLAPRALESAPTYEKVKKLKQRLAEIVRLNSLFEKKPEAKFYQIRVRSEGALGNKITKQLACLNVDEKCVCSSDDTND